MSRTVREIPLSEPTVSPVTIDVYLHKPLPGSFGTEPTILGVVQGDVVTQPGLLVADDASYPQEPTWVTLVADGSTCDPQISSGRHLGIVRFASGTAWLVIEG